MTLLGWIATAGAAPVSFGAAADEWSIGGETSWRTTPLRARWAAPADPPYASRWVPDASWRSEPAIHVVGTASMLVADLAVGNEIGWTVWDQGYERYSGWRLSARAGVTVLSTRAPPDAIDPLQLSVGAGVIGWAACCSVSSSYVPGTRPAEASTSATVWAANRLWLWEPLGLDLRYEVPLARGAWYSTVEAGVVFARRR